MPRSRLPAAVAVLAALLFAGAVVRLAWVGDDAFITMRTVENWLGGHGLRWNVADRVQTYTNPLWMFLAAAARWISGEAYFSLLVLSALATAGCLCVLAATARGGAASITAMLLAAVSSRAFVDYCTSGLENPLSHLLVALFACVWFRTGDPLRRLRRLALLGGLLACTRMDLSLLAVPGLLAAARQVPLRSAAAALALGALPFAVWIAFALLYYGTPFPSTAYSKVLATGLPIGEMLGQGLLYLADVCIRDPATALVLALGIGVALPRAGRAGLPLALGVVLYLLYVLRIGGGFMAGRFTTTPFVLCLALLLVRTRGWPPWHRVLGGLALFLVACIPGLPAAVTGSGRPADEVERWNIHDVRQLGWRHCGLCSPHRRLPSAGVLTEVMRARGVTTTLVDVNGVVGERGYNAGPQFHIVDFWLCDPVLCRLPTVVREDWIISHFTRRIPEGYLEFVAFGDDRFCHPGFARFVRAVSEVTRGELWSWRRLRTALALLGGAYDEGLARFLAEDYFTPPRGRAAARELARDGPPAGWWFSAPCRVVYPGGLDVAFDGPQHGSTLELMVQGGPRYCCEWRDGERSLGSAEIATDTRPYVGMESCRVEVPAAAQGFTVLRLSAVQHREHVAAVAAVRVLQ